VAPGIPTSAPRRDGDSGHRPGSPGTPKPGSAGAGLLQAPRAAAPAQATAVCQASPIQSLRGLSQQPSFGKPHRSLLLGDSAEEAPSRSRGRPGAWPGPPRPSCSPEGPERPLQTPGPP